MKAIIAAVLIAASSAFAATDEEIEEDLRKSTAQSIDDVCYTEEHLRKLYDLWNAVKCDAYASHDANAVKVCDRHIREISFRIAAWEYIKSRQQKQPQ